MDLNTPSPRSDAAGPKSRSRSLSSLPIHTRSLPKSTSVRTVSFAESPMTDAVLAAVLRRDRAVVLTCLIMLVMIAWSYVLWLALDMDMRGMEMPEFRMIPAGMGLMMPMTAPWQQIEFAFVFVMWAVMMVGMMTPSAAPQVLLYARVGRQVGPGEAPFAASAWFVGGYLVVWVAFSLIARSPSGQSNGPDGLAPRWQ